MYQHWESEKAPSLPSFQIMGGGGDVPWRLGATRLYVWPLKHSTSFHMLWRFLPCELQFCEIFSLFWGEQEEEVELANDIWRLRNEKASQRSEF